MAERFFLGHPGGLCREVFVIDSPPFFTPMSHLLANTNSLLRLIVLQEILPY